MNVERKTGTMIHMSMNVEIQAIAKFQRIPQPEIVAWERRQEEIVAWSDRRTTRSIGTKEENPEEARLDFPEELSQAEQTEFDFRGVAGAVATAASVKTVATPETGSQPTETETETDSPEVEMEELLSDDGDYMADKIQVTPVQLTQVRQSQKISGKKFKFAETSPENSSGQSELVKTIHLMKKMETCVGI
ncbi:hypothetical protein Bca52824_065060 [Brassica carinata]|uniref:Uncharacterized protein n=1 Tax=Brassica carinata TaxID=52824 RepID=A0A8X7QKZ8_BRACI|nr:hypothetical protein Bca52824_065060 [Brassica carinata]